MQEIEFSFRCPFPADDVEPINQNALEHLRSDLTRNLVKRLSTLSKSCRARWIENDQRDKSGKSYYGYVINQNLGEDGHWLSLKYEIINS